MDMKIWSRINALWKTVTAQLEANESQVVPKALKCSGFVLFLAVNNGFSLVLFLAVNNGFSLVHGNSTKNQISDPFFLFC